MYLLQASAEPILVGGAVTGIGGLAVWAIITLVSVRDSVRDMHHAMFGHPDSKEDTGLIITVANHGERIGTLEWHINNTVSRSDRPAPPSDR